MSIVKELIKTLNERPAAKLFFILLIASFFIVPAFVYIHNFDTIQDVDNFINKDFKGGKITDIEELERPTSRGSYKRIEVDGQESPTYPVLINDFYSDTLIAVGQTIWKDAKSRHFKIKTKTTEINYELSDPRKSRRIELIITLTIAIVLFGLLTFLNTKIPH